MHFSNLAFWLQSGPFDNAQAWADQPAADRDAKKQAYADAGIALMVSAFGATDIPTAADPTTVANNLAAYVKNNNLDGVDVDYEDLDGFNSGSGASETWLINFTKALRAQLPQGQYIITHAPLAPWFTPNRWGGGGYLKVHQEVGSLIDWYNIQFYNQGVSEYTTCDGLFNTASAAWPQSAALQIVAAGVPAEKVVVGKPGTAADASNGFVDPGTLAGCVSSAKSTGWSEFSSLEFLNDNADSYLQTVVSWLGNTPTLTLPGSRPSVVALGPSKRASTLGSQRRRKERRGKSKMF